MKKLAVYVLLASALLLFAGCAPNDGSSPASGTATVPEILSQAEYLLYQNVFYNDYGPQYLGTKVTKEGIFASLQDAYAGKTRYYVWGYLDATHCCDWQWEIVPKDTSSLPPPGSLVTVTGVFSQSDQALDGYWITDAGIDIRTRYTGGNEEIDMYTMSCTLERVQMFNILYKPEAFKGKSFSAYGRVAGTGSLEDPYYDGSWQIPFTGSASVPAMGTLVRLSGRIGSGTLEKCSISVMP